MINDLTDFAKYKDSQSGIEEISSKDDLNEFQKDLFRNWDRNLLVGKGRRQGVTTSFEWLAYYRAAMKGQNVAIKVPKTDYFMGYSKNVRLFCSKSDIQRNNKKELKFTNGGTIQGITNFRDYRSRSFHSVIVDETGSRWNINPVCREIEEARHRMPSQVIVSVTIREKNTYNDERYMQNLNQLLWTLKEYHDHFKYIEAWDKGTLLSDRDIRAYQSMIK